MKKKYSPPSYLIIDIAGMTICAASNPTTDVESFGGQPPVSLPETGGQDEDAD